jgi:hypothetical protein
MATEQKEQDPPKTIWVRVRGGRIVEWFRTSQEANMSTDQEHIHAYNLDGSEEDE